jgi:uncharacterized protein
MKTIRTKKSIWLCLLTMSCSSHAQVKPLAEIKPIVMCGEKLLAEVARNDEDRSRGLMGRTSIAKGKAMVFVFEEEREISFWMKNVPFDIDIGFFDAKGAYVSHTTMKGTSPMQLESALPSYPSIGPAKYAVEVIAGHFSKVKTKSCQLKPLL